MCYEVIDNNLIFVKQNKARNTSFELLRIVAMLLIIAHHFAVHAMHFYTPNFYNSLSVGNKILVDIFLPGGTFGVALFFMITGYFMIDKKRINILNLLLEVSFYGLVLATLIILGNIFEVKYMDMSNLAINQSVVRLIFSPTTSNAWWVLGSNKFDNVTDGAAAFAVLGNNQIARNGISTDMVTSKAGGLDCRRVSESLGVRPMIAIIPSAIITNSSQDGTASNPYIVKEN